MAFRVMIQHARHIHKPMYPASLIDKSRHIGAKRSYHDGDKGHHNYGSQEPSLLKIASMVGTAALALKTTGSTQDLLAEEDSWGVYEEEIVDKENRLVFI